MENAQNSVTETENNQNSVTETENNQNSVTETENAIVERKREEYFSFLYWNRKRKNGIIHQQS